MPNSNSIVNERKFQAELINDIYKLFPDCLVLKNDANYIQGIPDLTVLFKNGWALLECKKSSSEPHQPNQSYYIKLADRMSFGRFIFPENKEDILRELQQTFGP